MNPALRNLPRLLRPALVLTIGTALGAQATPLASVPERLPRWQRDSLLAWRTSLEASIDSTNAEIALFNARCGAVGPGAPGRAACEAALGPLGGRAQALEVEKQDLARAVREAVARVDAACPTIDERLRRDQEALRRQQAVSATSAGELEALARESEDAQRAAIGVGISALFGEAVNRLTARGEQVQALERLVTRHEARLRTGGADVALLRAQLERAKRAYGSAAAAAGAGRTYQRAGELDALMGLARAEAAAIERTAATADGEARRLLTQPALRQLLLETPELGEFTRAITDHVSATPQFERFAPAYSLAAFAVDYGYEAARWAAAADQIIARNAVTPQQLAAVASLRRQMERSMQLKQACALPRP